MRTEAPATLAGAMLAGLLDLLAPERCLGCRARAAPPWCPSCWQLVRSAPAGCRRCAAPKGAGHACWPPDAPIEATMAAFDYRGPVQAAVVTAKLAGARSGWPGLASHLAAKVREVAPDVDVVTWVTTPSRRVRERGVDHAAVLAAAVADRIGRPAVALLDARPAARGGDDYRARVRLPGSNVLLVDDVVTTGATAWRAADVLRTAGAGRVELAVLARAGTHPLGVTSRVRAR